MVQRGIRADVELVEDDDAAGGTPGAASAPVPTARRHAGGRRAGLVAAAVVVAALATAQLLSDARERAELAAVRALPGVLAPVPDALEVTWRVPADRLPLPLTAGAPVGPRGTPLGAELVALDPTTGADAWALPLAAAPADAADALGTPLPSCAVPAPGPPAHVTCLVTDAWQRDAGLLPQDVPATTSRLVVVRTADGTVASDHVVDAAPGAPATSVALLGDVAVLGHPTGDGLVVRGVDPATGRELWRHDAVRPDLPTLAPAVAATGGAVLVPAGDGLDLLDAGGRLLRHVPVPAGATTGWSLGPGGTPVRGVADRGSWRLLRAERDVVLPGPPVHVSTDDGSAGALVLAASAHGLHAIDPRAGRQRWSVRAAGVQEALVLRGRVHAVTEDGVTTYDARTGAVRWTRERPAAEVLAGPVRTDGRDLVVPVADATTGEVLRLDRLAAADGRTGTAVRVPAGLSAVTTRGGLLVGWALADDDVVALG